jgi:excisionase family DNA binding protein
METRPENGLLTVQDAAKFLAVSTSTLYGWVWQRRIAFVKVGRALRFERAELEKLVQANRFQPRTSGRFSDN